MNRRLRVTFIAGEYPPLQGGLGDYTRELGRALIHRGHSVCVITRRLAGEPRRDDDDPVVYEAVRGWNWRAWPRVRDIAASAHIVHLQYQTAAYGMHPLANALPWLLRRVRRVPSEHVTSRRVLALDRPVVVTTYHDTRVPYLFPKAGRVRSWATLAPAWCSDGVVATNGEDGATLERAASRLAMIPIGSNIAPRALPDARTRGRERWGIGPAEPLLVYFGFVNRAKGADTLVAALARLHALGTPARLLMLGGQVGASDPTNVQYLAEVRALAAKVGVERAIVWTDFLPDDEVSTLLRSADIAALPYRDGVSLQRGTLMAALAHGLPIVTTLPRLMVRPSVPLPTLEDDVHGVLVPPDDPDALAAALHALWLDPARRARLGKAGCELAGQFSWDRIAEQHVALYRELIHGFRKQS